MEKLSNTTKFIYFLCALMFIYMCETPPMLVSRATGEKAPAILPEVWMICVILVWAMIVSIICTFFFFSSAVKLWLNKEISTSVQDMWCLYRDQPNLSFIEFAKKSFYADSRRVEKIMNDMPQAVGYPVGLVNWINIKTFSLVFGEDDDDESASLEPQEK